MFLFDDLKRSLSRRRSLVLLICLLVLPVFYQNCGGQMQTYSQDQSSLGNSTSGAEANTNSSGAGAASSTGSSAAEQAARIAACKALMGAPQIKNISLSEVTLGSGLGVGSGDANAAQSILDVDTGVSDQEQATRLACGFSTQVSCAVVSDDAGKKPLLNSAVTLAGDQVAPQAVTDTAKAAILGGAINKGNGICSGALDSNRQRKISLTNLRNNPNGEVYRCVDGVVWLALTARTQIDNANRSTNSNTVYLKVNLQNKCWNESRLKAEASLPQLIQYGSRVALDGSWAAVVAPKEHLNETVLNVGAVYLFQQISGIWKMSQKIYLPQALSGETVSDVALKGRRLVISSSKRSGSGAVFLYSYNGSSWDQVQKIDPPVTSEGQQFGSALALNDSYLVVGAPQGAVNANSAKSGLVYVFTCDASSCAYKMSWGWQETAGFPEGSAGGLGIGSSLSLDDHYLAVGAPQVLTRELESKGRVAVYDISGNSPVLLKTLSPADGEMGMKFGASLSLSGLKLIVGASMKANGNQSNAGGVYYFEDYSKSVTRMLSGPSDNANFGTSVVQNADGILVGCPYCANRSGQVFYYNWSALSAGTNPTFKLFNLNQARNDAFGFSLACRGNQIIVGANIKSDPNNNSGASYIYGIK